MHTMLDDGLVGGALIASGLYAIVALGPRALRRRLLSALARAAARFTPIPGLGRLAGRLERAAAAKAAACGGCSGCAATDGGAAPPNRAAPPGAAPNRQGEVRVPVARIGRR